MANRNMLYIFRLGAEWIARPLAWSPGASVRQLSFYGPVRLYLGILFVFCFPFFPKQNTLVILYSQFIPTANTLLLKLTPLL